MVGIRDVARHSGVSTATVVRVLRDSGLVGPELTDRVRQSVKELGYVPNSIARSLSSGRTQSLGLIIPDIANPFFSELARGVEDAVAPRSYHVLVGSSNLNSARESELMTAFAGRTVDAVIMMPMNQEHEQVERLINRGIPVILVGGRLAKLSVPTVISDGRRAAYDAIKYLFGLGHTDIGMVTGPPGFRTVAEGTEGYHHALKDCGLDSSLRYLERFEVGIDGGHDGMAKLLDRRSPPTACITLNNLLTVGALHAIRERGLSIPKDISLISFDDMPTYAFIDPPLTAVAQPAYEIGRSAGLLALRSLDGSEEMPSEPVTIASQFHERDSCGPPPARVHPADNVQPAGKR